jgi:hypothetical protein
VTRRLRAQDIRVEVTTPHRYDVAVLEDVTVGPKATAEVHDYHDERTGVLALSLAKRA